MHPVRALLHLLLSLALVAGGLLPDVARAGTGQDMHATASADDAPPCHQAAPDPAPSADAAVDLAPGCCDDGGCACDCLHHAPVALVFAPRLLSLPVEGLIPAVAGRSAPEPAPLRSLRPPIA